MHEKSKAHIQKAKKITKPVFVNKNPAKNLRGFVFWLIFTSSNEITGFRNKTNFLCKLLNPHASCVLTGKKSRMIKLWWVIRIPAKRKDACDGSKQTKRPRCGGNRKLKKSFDGSRSDGDKKGNNP